MRLFVLVLLAFASACGSNRDPMFYRIVQFSAVSKLELGGGHVYFSEGNQLKRVPKAGGPIETVVMAGVADFAATDGHVYAATNAGVVHLTLQTGGGIVSTDTLSSEPALAVAADANGVTWVNCSAVTSAALDGSNQVRTPLPGPCANQLTRLAIDSSTVYGMNTAGQWYTSRSGGEVKPLAAEKCSRLEAAGGWLYCSDRDFGLRRFSPRTKDVELVIDGQVHTFSIGESRIYAGVGQDLVSSPRNTSRQEVLGTYAAISAIALDASDVYFVNTEGNLGLLLRTAQ